MSMVSLPNQPLRLFLDAGVILDGNFGSWGASKAVLILATLRANYTVVLAEAIEREVQRAVARKTASVDATSAAEITQTLAGWLSRVRIERYPLPSDDAIRARIPDVLPALRHINDLPPVVTAIQAQPDWVLSTNTRHWSAELAARINLRIATPLDFLRQLYPHTGG